MHTPDSPTPATPGTASTPLAAKHRRHGWLALPMVLALALLASGAAWVWSGSEGSLATTLQLASQLMPDQSLSTRQVQGSLQRGGRISQLHWHSQGLSVQAQDAELALDWPRLWQGQLPLTALKLGQLHIDDRRAASAPVPMTSLGLPLTVQLPLQIGQLHWAGPPALDIADLQADYAFDGRHHSLTLAPFDLAQGRYSAQARLQAAAPMALKLSVQGLVHTPTQGRTRPLTLDASASVQGTLSGPQAQLALAVQLVPATTTKSPTPAPNPTGMQLDLKATLRPWQSQPVQDATGQWQQVDLASLWPGAPQTRLNGQGTVAPDGEGWQFNTQWRNAQPGPWNSARLPLSQLDTRLIYRHGLWQMPQLSAQLAGGHITAQGEQTASGWTGQLDLAGVQPAQLHTALTGPALQGRLQAQRTDSQAIAFTADLGTTPASTPGGHPTLPQPLAMSGLSWEQLHLQGLWQASVWDIQSIDAHAAHARLQGHFQFQPSQRAAQGELHLSLPGLSAQVQGELAPQKGQGQARIEVQDAALTQSWLQRWPGLSAQLQAVQASGPAQLQAQWQGGYQQTRTQVQATLQTPRLTGRSSGASPWQLEPGELQLQGPLQDLQANVRARLRQGQASIDMQTRLSARPTTDAQGALTGTWQGQLQSTRLSAVLHMPAAATPLTWTARLADAVNWQWRTVPDAQTLNWDAGVLQLNGPPQGVAPGSTQAAAHSVTQAGALANGQARMSWSPGEWAHTPARPTTTRGAIRLDELPLSWLPGLIGPEFQSDVLLRGDLSWALQEQWRMQAVLERSQGDLRIAADNAPGQRLNAGLRTARMQWQVNGDEVQTEWLWDSEQMGQAKAQAQTRLSRGPDGWYWPENAPLSGQLQASLPRVGAWSLLAPPGWRVQGTLDARMNLSGTRAQPQWQGVLQADNLAVRSAVQGIEFSQGQLRARLQGQQVELQQLSLRGAGAQGGELQATGQLNWHPAATAQSAPVKPWGEVDMALQIQAKGLRVSNRADRRLAISGDVTARMQQGQLLLRGLVQADQALFILPEDSTPTLGDDVVVAGARSLPTSAGTTPVPSGPSWIGTPDVLVRLDLGPDFQVKGLGLTSRLTGQVSLTSNAATKGQPRLTGEVRTDSGRYKAYGQQLRIDTGVLRFNGPYDNPNLDIVAIRPNLSQRVGVQITGTALLPRVRLYADPDMPDADKLAWLVLGRPAAGGGAESAVLQQAALALLGGNGKTISGELASSLGLDEISLASGSRSDTTATGTAVTLGKRLSKDFYLIYEASLQGTFGSFYVFYDLSNRLTLRAQAGQVNALDLIFTVRRD